MKDAKTITEFVKNVCFHYSICYSAYFCDYDENDQLVPAPIFEDDFVTPGKLNYLSKLLGMSTEDIANAAVFLCEDASSFINGVVLPVDSGCVAGK